MKILRTTLGSLVAISVAGLPMLAGGLASAASAGVTAAGVVPCKTNAAARTTGEGDVPLWRRGADTKSVTERDLDALPAAETRPGVVTREVAPRLAARVVIPVFVHVIKGTHRGERVPTGPDRIRKVISILNQGMAGAQSQQSTPTRYRFRLKKIDYTKRDGWYHAYFNGPRDQKMKRALHRGNARTLNLYINGGGPKNNPVLGWSRFPWQYAGAPKLDAVSVNVQGLPGGRATGYNRGDTVIHETGHWLGLLHTFEGGCGSRGDLVVDTPAEAEASFGCDTTRDTCTAPGLDPVHNFMDYSLDRCMNRLTAGQVDRMDTAFVNWRQ